MSRFARALFLVFVLSSSVIAADGGALRPFLVKDIDVKPLIASSNPANFVVAGSKLFFVAATAENGNELWVSDGTPAGTRLVRDVMPGPLAGVSPEQKMVVFNGEIYFDGRDPVHGNELWKSDGTAFGTVMVKEFSDGIDGGAIFMDLYVAGGRLVIMDGDHHLWSSDGTTAGTQRVASVDVVQSIRAGGASYVVADFVSSVVRVDIPSGARTELTKTAFSGPSDFDSAVLPDGSVVFISHGDLYHTDGTPSGTSQIKDFTGFERASRVGSFAAGAFVVVAGAGTDSQTLWLTDGTVAGTKKVEGLLGPQMVTPYGGKLLLTAVSNSRRDVFLTDGSVAGTVNLTQGRQPVPTPDSSHVLNAAVLGGMAYFPMLAPPAPIAAPPELWRTDGTPGGTQKVVATGDLPTGLVAWNDALYFAGFDLLTGREPFRSDGTAAGTAVLHDIALSDEGASPKGLISAFGALFFFARTDNSDAVLWRTKGGDTRPIKTVGVFDTSESGPPRMIGECGGLLYFVTTRKLWRTDGTADGTAVVSESGDFSSAGACTASGLLIGVRPNGASSSMLVTRGTPATTTTFGTQYGFEFQTTSSRGTFFSGTESSQGPIRLYRSDGTAAGTTIVSPTLGTAILLRGGDRLLYFIELAETSGLWRSDGTAAGTFRLLTFAPLNTPVLGPVIDDVLYFTLRDPATGQPALWRSDGTVEGTRVVRAFAFGVLPEVVRYKGAVYFPAWQQDDWDLWRTDGTAAGTVQAAAIGAFGLSQLAVAGDQLFFTANVVDTFAEANLGTELYAFDGTTAALVADLNPGHDGSSPGHLTAAGNALYFTAANRLGAELWAIWLSGPPRTRAAGR